MKIAVLGLGSWGYCLARHLAKKGYPVFAWSRRKSLVETLQKKNTHPRFPKQELPSSLQCHANLEHCLKDADLIIESLSSQGIRPVFERIDPKFLKNAKILLSSKGIEKDSHKLFSELLEELLGSSFSGKIACLSGPSHAEEVIEELPTSLIAASYDQDFGLQLCKLFETPFFRVYPNVDLKGVEFGAAMKNIIAIACGISDGLGFGDNAKAALMTRGLHEIRKLSVLKGCRPETLNGLSGLGDLCVTCLSTHSRNYRFGRSIGQGKELLQAKAEVSEVVEGSYTCVAAHQMAQKHKIEMPITKAVYQILFEHLAPKQAVATLMQRSVKEEHL